MLSQNRTIASHKTTYEQKSIVVQYTKAADLQKPELTILSRLKNKLSEMTMLDIGVGAGRTSRHFAPLVKKYVGVDYSQNMVASCEDLLPTLKASAEFHVCDARSMEMFDDNSFDFILFSFNGIDSVSHDDRHKVYEEVKRVAKSGAYFAFSTHNLQHINELYKIHFKRNPVRLAKEIARYLKVRSINGSKNNYLGAEYALIHDGAHDFRLPALHYILPDTQKRQLEELNFKSVEIYSLNTGNRIHNNLESVTDGWIYFLCRVG